jgi:hypothetical protein
MRMEQESGCTAIILVTVAYYSLCLYSAGGLCLYSVAQLRFLRARTPRNMNRAPTRKPATRDAPHCTAARYPSVGVIAAASGRMLATGGEASGPRSARNAASAAVTLVVPSSPSLGGCAV